MLRQAVELEKRASNLRSLAENVRTKNICRELHALLYQNEVFNDDFDLLRAALLIAKLDGEEIDVESYAKQVDRMAKTIQQNLPKDARSVEI